MKKSSISRRNFLGKAATVGVAGVVVPTIITSCARETKKVVEVPTFLDQAPDGPVLKAGVIGCGGRGSGAAINFLNAGPNLQVTALGDTFQDRVDSPGQAFSNRRTRKFLSRIALSVSIASRR